MLLQKQSDEQLLLDLNKDLDAISSAFQSSNQSTIKKSAQSLTTKQKLEVCGCNLCVEDLSCCFAEKLLDGIVGIVCVLIDFV